MQVRPAAPAPLAFDRVDQPVEALAAPTVDVVSLQMADSMLQRAEAVEVHDTITDPQGGTAELSYRIEPAPQGFSIKGTAGDNPIDRHTSRPLQYAA